MSWRPPCATPRPAAVRVRPDAWGLRLGRSGIGLLALASGLVFATPVDAHEGPPFPIAVDEPVLDRQVSVWADPDIGTGTFYVILEDGDGSAAGGVSVDVWVRAGMEGAQRMLYPAREQSVGRRTQFIARPDFDHGGPFRVGIVIRNTAVGTQAELQRDVVATPDGLGPISVAAALIPFVSIGGLWAAALIRRARI